MTLMALAKTLQALTIMIILYIIINNLERASIINWKNKQFWIKSLAKKYLVSRWLFYFNS